MTKEGLGGSGHGVISETKISNSDELVVSENNRSIWGLVINNVLRKAGGEIGEYRFRGISLEINGKDLLLAQGIWNEKEAEEVKTGVKDNKPRNEDYSELGNVENGGKRITFTSKTEVIDYLVANGLFVQKGDPKKKEYRLTCFPILWYTKSPLKYDIRLCESFKKGYTFFVMDIPKANL